MKKIRINELARELEVKAHEILDRLPELGVTEKKTHSSSIDDDVALQLRHLLGHPAEAGAPEEYGPAEPVATTLAVEEPQTSVPASRAEHAAPAESETPAAGAVHSPDASQMEPRIVARPPLAHFGSPALSVPSQAASPPQPQPAPPQAQAPPPGAQAPAAPASTPGMPVRPLPP